MLYVNKATGDLVHLLEWVGPANALVYDIRTKATYEIKKHTFLGEYISVNTAANRKSVAGCYSNKVK
jgi:hypothetical protein